LAISIFQLAYKKEPARTIPAAPKPQVPQASENQFLPSGLEDCEPSVDPEDFGKRGVGVEVEPENPGKGGVGVEVESEYDLELRIGGNVGRLGMGHPSLLTVQTARW
jgi:hypothetical protein